MSVYSGKDDLIQEIFLDTKDRFFIDVGACEGINGSHTYTLERDFGWNGICIEGNPEVYNILKEQRKNHYQAVVFSSEKEVDFCLDVVPPKSSWEHISHAYGGGSGIISSMQKSQSDLILSRGGGKTTIKTETLNSIMNKLGVPKYIEFLDIDIEEADYEALISIDWSQYRFGCILIEDNSEDVENKMRLEEYTPFIQFSEGTGDRLYLDSRNRKILERAANSRNIEDSKGYMTFGVL